MVDSTNRALSVSFRMKFPRLPFSKERQEGKLRAILFPSCLYFSLKALNLRELFMAGCMPGLQKNGGSYEFSRNRIDLGGGRVDRTARVFLEGKQKYKASVHNRLHGRCFTACDSRLFTNKRPILF